MKSEAVGNGYIKANGYGTTGIFSDGFIDCSGYGSNMTDIGFYACDGYGSGYERGRGDDVERGD